jgi:mycoredoxin
MKRRWRGALTLFVGGVVLGVAQAATGSIGAGVAVFLVFALLAGLVSPRAFPRAVTDAQARRLSAADGRPIVYWRPGCPFCIRMRATLGRDAARVHWVDIWADPEGAASVRAITGGDETVPTVVQGTEALVNPSPNQVRAMVRP